MDKMCIKNKIVAVIMMLLAMVPIALYKDGTALLFMGIFAIPMFFSKRDWFEEEA